MIMKKLSTGSAELDAFFERQNDVSSMAEQQVAEILQAVRTRGDQAVLEYTQRFDQFEVDSVEQCRISEAELAQAHASISPSIREALTFAHDRLCRYAEHQKQESWSFQDELGNDLGQRVTALDKVGVYVPGGKAAYPSSVLMNVVPAKIAGVDEIVMVTPTPGGVKNPLVLAAAYIAGVDQVFTLGGAQAVAALAYGTETVPSVAKIVGPGNIYVATAKRQVFGVVGIDMIAGPSEILIIADSSANPDWVAMDLFSQAEHDELAQSILISPDSDLLARVETSIQRLLPTMKRADIIEKSLSGQGVMIHCEDLDEACQLANKIAPEHLELAIEDAQPWVNKINNAGAIFVGHGSCEAIGDYCAGPNHVLPTAGSARFFSPLGVYDFQKRTSVIRCSAKGASVLGDVAAILADGEGLEAHQRSAHYRVGNPS